MAIVQWKEELGMSGWSYLNGKRWSQVTRDERFFCQRLLARAENDLASFVGALRALGLKIAGSHWELAYEVCFYRDFRYARRDPDAPAEDTEKYSAKRTFDLCLFSEDSIVIIEAKAQQTFKPAQLSDFQKDKEDVKRLTGIEPQLLFLASSRYLQPKVITGLKSQFPGSETVSWRHLAELFGNDADLLRADSLFADASRSGRQLLDLWQDKFPLYVGRQRGVEGLRSDVRDGSWEARIYRTGPAAPNGNWMTLDEFASIVAPGEFASAAARA
jgi:hypothetical protein